MLVSAVGAVDGLRTQIRLAPIMTKRHPASRSAAPDKLSQMATSCSVCSLVSLPKNRPRTPARCVGVARASHPRPSSVIVAKTWRGSDAPLRRSNKPSAASLSTMRVSPLLLNRADSASSCICMVLSGARLSRTRTSYSLRERPCSARSCSSSSPTIAAWARRNPDQAPLCASGSLSHSFM